MKINVVLEPSDEGETFEEALSNIREAIQLYLEPVDDDLVMPEGILIQELEM